MAEHHRVIAALAAPLLVISLLSGIARPASAVAGDLLLTQYVEGSSFNKAIEIANLTGAPIDLSTYTLELYSNGAPTANQTVALTGTLGTNDVFVVANAAADPAILAEADLISSTVANWNGDDAIVLRGAAGVVDSFGQVGVDPGTEWGDAIVGAQNETLCRLPAIDTGDTAEADPFDPSIEWTPLGNDVFTGLGAVGCGGSTGGSEDLLFTQYVEGSGNNKAIEIANLTGAPVDLSTYIVERYTNGSLLVSGDQALSGTLADGEVIVVANSASAAAILAVADVISGVAMWNGDDALVLRNGTAVVDSIGQVGFDPGSQWGDAALGTQNNTLCRNADITDGDTDELDVFDPSVEWFALGQDDFSGLGDAGCVGEPPVDPVMYFIHEIQGSGPVAAITGPVIVEGVVTSLFEDDDVVESFFLQEEDAEADADPSTSEGIFVFCNGCAQTVAVGDVVSVTGIAGEAFGMTEVNVAGVGDISVISSGNPLPAATLLDLPAPAGTNLEGTFESSEAMLVTFPDKLVVSEYFNLARFGEIVLTLDERPFQFTHDNAPSVAGLTAFLADLATQRIVLDDGNSDQNETTSGPLSNEAYAYPQGGLSNGNRFRGGDSITNLTGALQWAFGAWRLQPTPGANYTFTAENPRPGAVDDVGGTLRVAGVNVLNYFTTIDDGVAVCGPSSLGCRGADSASELARQRDKTVAALLGLDADVIGLIEIENDGDDTTAADLVNGLNAIAGAGTYDYIATGFIGTDAIKVGLIYQPAMVTPAGAFAVLDSTVDPAFIDTKNRPVLIQTFEEVATGERFTVAVNHLKSKGSACDDVGDPGLNDGQANCSGTRTSGATALANYLATDPTGSGDPDVLIMGDLNSYAKEDPIVALNDAGYTDLIAALNGPEAYSFLFDGQLGYLDYAMANASLLSQVTGVAQWHINADESPLFDYNDDIRDAGEASFERESNALPIYEANELRASDHDPILVGLDLTPTCNGLRATIIGTAGDDRLNGTSGPDVIVGLGGDDRINGLSGADVICGGDGDDDINGNNGNDVIDGGPGTDRVNGNGGFDMCVNAESVSGCER